MSENKRHEAPEVVFSLLGDTKDPAEIEKLVAKRDALLVMMGMNPPDEKHEFWWDPSKEEE